MKTRTILIASTLLLAPSAAYAQTTKPSFSIDNTSCQESSGTCTYRIRKHGRLNNLASSVRFYTLQTGSTARAGTDYVHKSVIIPFAASELAKTVSVTLVKTPTLIEKAETITGKVAVITNARCYDCTAVATVLETPVFVPTPTNPTPPPPPPVITPPPDPTPPPPDPTPPPDPVPATQTCWNGQVILLTDTCPPVPPPPPPAMQNCWDGTVILATDTCPPLPPPPPPPVPTVHLDPRNCAEATANCTVYLWRSGDLTATSQVAWETTTAGTATPGTDFTIDNGTVSFAIGQQSANFLLPIINDATDESDETIGLKLTPVTNIGISTVGMLTILDDDAAVPPPPTTQTCPDGSVIPSTDTCPPPPPPPTTGGDIPSPTLAGVTPIASNFDINTTVKTSSTPGGTGVDPLGAFRFICGAGQIIYDDPILYPGQPGKSHLHQFFGNVGANGNSTYSSLRGSGDSTCAWMGNGTAANRSAYWMPAMLDGKGNVVRPDYVSIYYKQRPQSNPVVSDPAHPQYRGQAVQMPNGLRFIFGWDPTGINQIKTGGMWFACQGPTATSGKFYTLASVRAACPAGNQIGAVIEAPECWDGKRLDSVDHRSHMSYATYGTWGYLKCPTTHPYVIPTFSQGAWFTVAAGDDGIWELSSDHMAPTAPKGHTFHADFFMAWDPTIHNAWWGHCINLKLNCSGGQLGDGRQIKGAAQPTYNGTLNWKHPQRLVPVPANPIP